MRKPHCTEQALLKRRDVIKGGAVVLASAFFPFSIEILNAGSAVAAPPAPSGTGEERILWNSCNVNCGSRCALRVHVKDGVITRVETDNTGDDRYGMQQLRACPRGRSMRQRIYAEQRIPYPLRRVGNRGEGKFERISWEEAFKEIGQRLRGTIDTYGNEAVYLNYGTGALGSTMGKSWPPAATPVARLMNLVGGYLNHYSDYSTCQITVGMPYLYGGSWVDGNSLSDMENSELAVFFGNNPSETRMSGCKAKTLQHARFTRNTRVIIIDPRYTDSMVSVGDEAKSIYDICAGVANELGVKEAFTEGRTQYQWLEKLYAESRKDIPELPPTLEEAYTMGVYKRYFPENHIAYKAFRDDPEANPLPSPSGKIEIYSPRLAELAETWTLLPGQAITALPEYIPNPEGAISPERKEWPLQLIGHHYKQRTHSTYGNCWWLQEVAPQELWINPIDAKARGIEFGDRVKVFNGRGVSFVKAKITPRIMPGVVSLPEGAWHTPNAAGEDTNGCVNVLTKLLPTALAKGNPHHTNLVQVEKA